MTDERFFEDTVTRKPSVLQKILAVVLILLATTFLIGGVITLVTGAGFIFIMASIILYVMIYFLIRSMSLEFDYNFTGGYFDIARVIGKAKRKTLFNINFKEDTDILAPLTSPSLRESEKLKIRTYDCTGSDPGALVYCIVGKDSSNKGEQFRAYFEPDMEMLRAMHRVKPREVIIADD